MNKGKNPMNLDQKDLPVNSVQRNHFVDSDQRNTLEYFVYDTRSKIAYKLTCFVYFSFAYKSFASDIEKDEITKSLQETEDCLYDDESDEHDYTGKLNDLEKGSATVVSYTNGKQTLNISEDD
ncbi:heat shock protein 70 family protein [Tanacetum coccineum]